MGKGVGSEKGGRFIVTERHVSKDELDIFSSDDLEQLEFSTW